MQYQRCKCGKSEQWTSMGSQDCQGCPECNTTFASHPDGHRELQPHEWVTMYNQKTGKPYKVCKNCHRTDAESYKESNVKSED